MDKSTRFEQLLEALCEGDKPVSRLHLDDFSDLDSAHAAKLIEAWPRIPLKRRRALMLQLGRLANEHIELSFEAVNRLVLEDADEEVRRSAIDNLWECEEPSLVEPFVKALRQDVAPAVRVSAAIALGRFVLLGQMDQVSPRLLGAAEASLLGAYGADPQSTVRQRALESLGYSSRAEVHELIKQAHDSGIEGMVGAALVAMGRSADPRWHPQVLAKLRSPAPMIRREAACAAGELDLQVAVPELIELLEDVDQGVRRAAVWSLGELGGKQAQQALLAILDSTEDSEETHLVEDALDNLAFVNGTRDFLLYEFDDTEDEDS